MRGAWQKILGAVIVLGALTALAYRSRHKIHLADFTWHKFAFAVSQANLWLLLLSLVAIYVCYGLRAVRWQRFSRYLGPTKFIPVYNGTVMGFASIFLLGRPGEPVRPLLLARKTRQPVSSMFGIWVLERIFDFASAVGLAVLSLLVFSSQLSDAGASDDWVDQARRGGWVLLALLAGVIVFLIYYRFHGAGAVDRLLDRWRFAGGWRGWLASIIGGFSEGLQAIRTVSDLLLALLYSALHWALIALAYLWISHAFGGDLSSMNFSGAMLLLAVTMVGSTLQLPGVGGGAQVASFVALTQIFGIEQEPAAAAAIAFWLITFAAAALGGVPLLIHEGLSMGELKKLVRAEEEAEESGAHITLMGSSSHAAPRDGTRNAQPADSPPLARSREQSRTGRPEDPAR